MPGTSTVVRQKSYRWNKMVKRKTMQNKKGKKARVKEKKRNRRLKKGALNAEMIPSWTV